MPPCTYIPLTSTLQLALRIWSSSLNLFLHQDRGRIKSATYFSFRNAPGCNWNNSSWKLRTLKWEHMLIFLQPVNSSKKRKTKLHTRLFGGYLATPNFLPSFRAFKIPVSSFGSCPFSVWTMMSVWKTAGTLHLIDINDDTINDILYIIIKDMHTSKPEYVSLSQSKCCLLNCDRCL